MLSLIWNLIKTHKAQSFIMWNLVDLRGCFGLQQLDTVKSKLAN